MNRLTEIRKERGYTQAYMANSLGISRQAYSNYELGNREPDNSTLIALADFFDITVDYLLGREATQKEKPADNVGEPMSPLDKELYDLLSTLSVEEKEMLLASIKAVKSRREQPASPQQ